jgi:hypothetical protein
MLDSFAKRVAQFLVKKIDFDRSWSGIMPIPTGFLQGKFLQSPNNFENASVEILRSRQRDLNQILNAFADRGLQ